MIMMIIYPQVVHRYDIILIQEIRDVTEETIITFTEIVNQSVSNFHDPITNMKPYSAALSL